MKLPCQKTVKNGLLVLLALAILAPAVKVLRSDYNLSSAIYVASTESAYTLQCSADSSAAPTSADIAFTDATSQLDKVNGPRTFSLAASDLSGDGWDDLLIGTHNGRPQLLINAGKKFRNESGKLATANRGADWHGATAVDLNNDGRLDLAFAGGGADGVGKGTPNAFFKNTTRRGVGVKFEPIKVSGALGDSAGRTRAFLTVPSPTGRAVDLYSAALPRNGHPNQYWVSERADEDFGLAKNASHWLARRFTDHGRGVITDFDNDGQADYLLINNSNAEIHWADKSRKASILATYAFSTAAGDFNNDGLMDIYIGRMVEPTLSDQISYNEDRINFVIHQNQRIDHSSLSFQSEFSAVNFNLKQNIAKGLRQYPADGSDIFLGRERKKATSRSFKLHRDDVVGKPENFRKSGIYIWYSDLDRRWNLRWQFQNYSKVYKGYIAGSPVSDIKTSGITTKNPDTTFDTLLINQGNGKFKRACSGALTHTLVTSGITLADLDSDGWLDIAGVRHNEQGAGGGEVFFIRNNQGKSFVKTSMPPHNQDLIFRPDLIVHGIFDRNNTPDLAMTYGYGQIPGTGGKPRLLLNQNPRGNPAMVIDLQGRKANTFAIGANVQLRDSKNQLIGTRIVGLNTNISQDTHFQHFGLGETSSPYKLSVKWPDGSESEHSISNTGYHKVKQPKSN